MTFDQFREWQQAYSQCPWGEDREDFRQAANTLWIATTDGEPPSLIYPYITSAEEMYETHQKLRERRQEPEHQEKLRMARIEHMKQCGKRK